MFRISKQVNNPPERLDGSADPKVFRGKLGLTAVFYFGILPRAISALYNPRFNVHRLISDAQSGETDTSK